MNDSVTRDEIEESAACDCARGHKNQIRKYPAGTRIVAITDIWSASDSLVPFGSTGKVTGHCDDGRAWIVFDLYDGSHTFHFPEQHIAKEWKP